MHRLAGICQFKSYMELYENEFSDWGEADEHVRDHSYKSNWIFSTVMTWFLAEYSLSAGKFFW